MPGRTSALHRLALVAATAAAADLVSKALAVAMLGERVVPVAGPLSLSLIYNTGSAGGVSLGAYTWLLNVAATTVTMVLAVTVCRAAAAFDRGAPVALGLVVGGALGCRTTPSLSTAVTTWASNYLVLTTPSPTQFFRQA